MQDDSKSCRSRISAGLLMFRRRNNELEVLLAHPGGPFFTRKDDGAWTIPKGEAAPGEDLLTRAQIEFEEEVGFRPESFQGWIELGSIKQKGGKIVHAETTTARGRDALLEMVSWKFIEFAYERSVRPPLETITGAWHDVLIEVVTAGKQEDSIKSQPRLA